MLQIRLRLSWHFLFCCALGRPPIRPGLRQYKWRVGLILFNTGDHTDSTIPHFQSFALLGRCPWAGYPGTPGTRVRTNRVPGYRTNRGSAGHCLIRGYRGRGIRVPGYPGTPAARVPHKPGTGVVTLLVLVLLVLWVYCQQHSDGSCLVPWSHLMSPLS